MTVQMIHCHMPSMSTINTDVPYDELEEEFRKLASLIPIIPDDRYISELELIEYVIAYIRQLQQLLSYDQWNGCIHTLTPLPTPYLFNQLMVRVPRNPLSTINLENTQSS